MMIRVDVARAYSPDATAAHAARLRVPGAAYQRRLYSPGCRGKYRPDHSTASGDFLTYGSLDDVDSFGKIDDRTQISIRMSMQITGIKKMMFVTVASREIDSVQLDTCQDAYYLTNQSEVSSLLLYYQGAVSTAACFSRNLVRSICHQVYFLITHPKTIVRWPPLAFS